MGLFCQDEQMVKHVDQGYLENNLGEDPIYVPIGEFGTDL
jgi:hypothetical protein